MNHQGVKIKKPHNQALDKLLNMDSTYIDNRTTGQYIAKKIKHEMGDIIGLHPIRQDRWIMYKKTDFIKFCEGSKYDFYRKK